jgi:hypothetical protein
VKRLCNKCNKLAVWCYMPRDRVYYCEEHVPRGCSCMTDDDGNPELDEQGRELPCCEYDYNEKGFYQSEA